MRRAFLPIILGVSSLVAVLIFYLATLHVQESLSPQGCRMSWMSPSYILQPDFNASWTPLAHRYSLWLYREVGWENNDIHGHQPVLFIPGNAGSSHQVRSIASSAVRQFYASPHHVSPEFQDGHLKPVDMFAVDFNEDLSAFHGPTIEAQIRFTSDAIAYILSRYPPHTTITILGHSMGGIVATSLLPSDRITAIITMSTPHTLPPARFDQRVDRIYDAGAVVLKEDPTPILSLCGGATDLMIPSESCTLEDAEAPFRRTVFSSALEGAWTGVGHREMVWCHQVRWRVARAVLELQGSGVDRGRTLDRWLRDGTRLPPMKENIPGLRLSPTHYTFVRDNERLVIDNPRGEGSYLLPMGSSASKFTLFVSKGSVLAVAPHKPLPLEVSLWACRKYSTSAEEVECDSLPPTILRLIPSPIPGKSFPVPGEGSDESEGVVFFEADISSARDDGYEWVAVKLERAEGVGWVVGDVSMEAVVTDLVTTFDLLFGGVTIDLDTSKSLHSTLKMPNVLSNALVVYRATRIIDATCKEKHLAPLLVQSSDRSEVHYFALNELPSKEILLHTHSAGPFTSSSGPASGVRLEFLSTGCAPGNIQVEIAWMPTFGRWASRYFTSIVCWAVGIVAIMLFDFWGSADKLVTQTVGQSLDHFIRRRLPALLALSFFFGLIPFSDDVFLGNQGEPGLAIIAPLLLVISTGLVGVSVALLATLLLPLKLVLRRPHDKLPQEVPSRTTFASMALILIAVFLLVPWQVAFLGCWAVHFMTCATTTRTGPKVEEVDLNPEREIIRRPIQLSRETDYNCDFHILVFMTWLLPLAAPVLVVWVRTLMTAGFTTPFDGDHFVLNVAPFLLLVEFNSRISGTSLFRRSRFEKLVSVRWAFLLIAAVAFVFGSRKAYMVFDTARLCLGVFVLFRIGPSYWRGSKQ